MNHYSIARQLCGILLLCLLSACSTPSRIGLEDDDAAHIKASQTILNTTQHHLGTRYTHWLNKKAIDRMQTVDSGFIVHTYHPYTPQRTYLAHSKQELIGASLGSAIGSAVVQVISNKHAVREEQHMLAIKKSLSDYDYMEVFKSSLSQALHDAAWLHHDKLSLQYSITERIGERT